MGSSRGHSDEEGEQTRPRFKDAEEDPLSHKGRPLTSLSQLHSKRYGIQLALTRWYKQQKQR